MYFGESVSELKVEVYKVGQILTGIYVFPIKKN